MTFLEEGNLRMSIPQNVKARKFDGSSHGLSHCMKAVDFIAELKDRVFFIEIKDPQHPDTREENFEEFLFRFNSGKLNEELKYKFRDSFLYEWASKKINKPIYYWVIVAIDTLTKADLLESARGLQTKLPLNGPPSGVWKRSIVADCAIFNIEAWNQKMPDYQISRIG